MRTRMRKGRPRTTLCEACGSAIVRPWHAWRKLGIRGNCGRENQQSRNYPTGLIKSSAAFWTHCCNACTRVLQGCANQSWRWWDYAYELNARLPPPRGILIFSQGIYIFHPTIAGYPHAKFPGVVLFSEIYQGVHFCSRDMPHACLGDARAAATNTL